MLRKIFNKPGNKHKEEKFKENRYKLEPDTLCKYVERMLNIRNEGIRALLKPFLVKPPQGESVIHSVILGKMPSKDLLSNLKENNKLESILKKAEKEAINEYLNECYGNAFIDMRSTIKSYNILFTISKKYNLKTTEHFALESVRYSVLSGGIMMPSKDILSYLKENTKSSKLESILKKAEKEAINKYIYKVYDFVRLYNTLFTISKECNLKTTEHFASRLVKCVTSVKIPKDSNKLESVLKEAEKEIINKCTPNDHVIAGAYNILFTISKKYNLKTTEHFALESVRYSVLSGIRMRMPSKDILSYLKENTKSSKLESVLKKAEKEAINKYNGYSKRACLYNILFTISKKYNLKTTEHFALESVRYSVLSGIRMRMPSKDILSYLKENTKSSKLESVLKEAGKEAIKNSTDPAESYNILFTILKECNLKTTTFKK